MSSGVKGLWRETGDAGERSMGGDEQCAPKPVQQPAPEVKAPVAAVASVSSVDVRFRFDRSGARDILPEDQTRLTAFVQELKQHYVRIDGITLAGHTDRLGSRAYNERLSLKRAETVRAELQRMGVDAPMSVKAMGATEHYSAGCHQPEGAEQTVQCLQPDRRVTVEVLGVRKPAE